VNPEILECIECFVRDTTNRASDQHDYLKVRTLDDLGMKRDVPIGTPYPEDIEKLKNAIAMQPVWAFLYVLHESTKSFMGFMREEFDIEPEKLMPLVLTAARKDIRSGRKEDRLTDNSLPMEAWKELGQSWLKNLEQWEKSDGDSPAAGSQGGH